MNPRRAPRTQPIQPPTFAPTKAKKPLIDSSTPSLVTDCEPGRFADRRRSWTPKANETRPTDGGVAGEQRQVERPRRDDDQPVGGIRGGSPWESECVSSSRRVVNGARGSPSGSPRVRLRPAPA